MKINYIEEDGLVYEVHTYSDGNKYWYCKGKLHRLDGSACEYTNGVKYYYINGKKFYTFEEYKEAVIQYKIKEILNEL